MKKLFLALLGMVVILNGFVGAVGQKEAQSVEVIEMRVATEPSMPDMTALLADRFAAFVKEMTGGKVVVELYLGGALGSQKELQEQVRLGTIESIVTASDIVEMDIKFGIFDFPFLFADRNHVYRVLDGDAGGTLNKDLIDTRGVRVLAFGELGFRQITNNVRPIYTTEDLRGIRLRVPPTKMRLQAFKALGASPTPIAWAELYQALQQGVVEGQENPLSAIMGASFYEVQKYLSISNHVYTPAYLLVNEKWWQGLPDDVRQQLQAAADEAVQWHRNYGEEQDSKVVEELKNKGMLVNAIDHASFVQKAKPVWQEFSEQVGSELVDMVIEASE